MRAPPHVYTPRVNVNKTNPDALDARLFRSNTAGEDNYWKATVVGISLGHGLRALEQVQADANGD